MTNRGAPNPGLSDPKQGRARAEMLKGGQKGGTLGQLLFIGGVLLGLVVLIVITTLLTSSELTSRWVGWGAIAFLVVAFILRQVRRRAKRISIDDTLTRLS